MNARQLAALVAAAVALAVAGCGYKGPLTLPPKPGEVTIRPAPTATAPATPTDAEPAKPATDTAPPTPPGTSDAGRG